MAMAIPKDKSIFFGREIDENEEDEDTYDQDVRNTRILLAGAIMYVAGSPWFVYQAYAGDSWLFYYRIGCVISIPGCVLYMIGPILAFPTDSRSARVSDALQVDCVVAFIIGCVLALIGDEAYVLDVTPAINALFLIGSICAAVDALKCSCTSCAGEGLDVQNYMDLLIATCFMIAGILGGYTTGGSMVFGLYFWGIGSICCLVGPLYALRQLRRSKFAQKNGIVMGFPRPSKRSVDVRALEMNLTPSEAKRNLTPSDAKRRP